MRRGTAVFTAAKYSLLMDKRIQLKTGEEGWAAKNRSIYLPSALTSRLDYSKVYSYYQRAWLKIYTFFSRH